MMAKLTLLLWIVTFALRLNPARCSVMLAASVNEICPHIRLFCVAEDLPSSTLRWFINDNEFSRYSNPDTPIHQYPYTLQPLSNVTYNSLVSSVNITILAASFNEMNRDLVYFNSSMTANISALQEAGVTKISCGSTGTRESYNLSFNATTNVLPKPQILNISSQYNADSELDNIMVMWNEVVSSGMYCILRGINYTVALEVEAHEIEQTQVSYMSCKSGICSVMLPLSASVPPTNQVYRISVTAMTHQGQSEPEIRNISIDGSIMLIFNHFLTYEDCATFASCNTTSSEIGNCTFQYGQDSSFQNLSPPISIPLNSTIHLPDIKVSTLYYIQVTFILNTILVVQQRNFSIQDNDRDCEPSAMGNELIIALSISFCVIFILAVVVSLAFVLLCSKKITKQSFVELSSEHETMVQCKKCGSTNIIIDFKCTIECKKCHSVMSNIKRGLVLLEEKDLTSAYIYKEIGLVFNFDSKRLCFYLVKDEVSPIRNEDKFLVLKLDMIKVDVPKPRPEVLNTLTIQDPDESKDYTIAFKSAKVRAEWTICLSKNNGHDETDYSSSTEEPDVVFAGTVEVARPKKGKPCDTLNWTREFIVWTHKNVGFYQSIVVKKPNPLVSLEDIRSVSGNNEKIEVTSMQSFYLRLLQKMQSNMANVFHTVVVFANPDAQDVDNHRTGNADSSQPSSSICDINNYSEIEKDWCENIYHSTSHQRSIPAPQLQHSSPASLCDSRNYSEIMNTSRSTKENYNTTSFKKRCPTTKMCPVLELTPEDYSSLDASRQTDSYNTVKRLQPQKNSSVCLDQDNYSHFAVSEPQYASTNHKKKNKKLDTCNFSQKTVTESREYYSHLMLSEKKTLH